MKNVKFYPCNKLFFCWIFFRSNKSILLCNPFE